MSRTIQSSNYVPGVSGWKLNADGSFEINSCTLGSAANAPERQMVSVEVASWSKYDLPKNAANLLQFMQAELERVPEQYRHAAEFEEFDASYGDESFNPRLFLSYSRLETEEELADRLAKAKVAGTRIVREGKCTTGIVDGVVRWRFGNLDAPLPEPEQPQPFKVDGDKVYLNEAFIDDGSVAKAKIGAGFYFPIPGVYVDADGRLRVKRDDASSDECLDSKLATNWSLKMPVNASGQYVVAGIGMGLPSQLLVSADQFALNGRDASEILRDIASKISETELGKQLKDDIDVGQVNERLDELKEKQGAENRAVAERLDCLATKLGELHTLISQTKVAAAAKAKREVAEALLRDLEADKSGGTFSDCIRRFGGVGIPFGGWSGMPLKVDYPKDDVRSEDDGAPAEAIRDWKPGSALKASGFAHALNAVSSASTEPRHVGQLVVDIEGFEADLAKVVKDVLRSELLPGGLLHRSR